MHSPKKWSLLAITLVAASTPAITAADDAPQISTPAASVVTANQDPCKVRYRQAEHRNYVRAVYRRERVSRVARARAKKMRACAMSPKAREKMIAVVWAVRKAREKRQRAAVLAALYRPHAHLRSIAQCESGGNPQAVSPSGAYRGKYQFDYQTWASVGGSGDPAAAPEWEQDKRAMMLYARRGAQPWPVCGR